MRSKFTFYFDAGHGWLQVQRSEAIELGVMKLLSPYSYQSKDGLTLYLEEDCDAPAFVEAYIKQYNITPTWDERESHGVRLLSRIK